MLPEETQTELPTVKLIAGSFEGLTSSVQTFSDMLYADVSMEPGATLKLSSNHEERAIFMVEGSIQIAPDNTSFHSGQLVVLKPGREIIVSVDSWPARVMLLGGEPVGERYIWWNFVSSSLERIEQAKDDWKGGKFDRVPGEADWNTVAGNKRADSCSLSLNVLKHLTDQRGNPNCLRPIIEIMP